MLILMEGMKYFLEMEQELVSRENRRNAIYSEWYETPIPLGEPWQGARYNSDDPISNITTLSIENHLYRYGFSIPIDSK